MSKTVRIVLICVLAAIAVASAVILSVAFTTHFTVRFETDGGDEIPSVENVEKGSKLPEPPVPIKTDYRFEGWFRDKAHTKPWIFASDEVRSNVTLYAKWSEDFSIGLSYELKSDGTYSVSKGSAMDSEMVIPSTHNGVAVTEIANSGFVALSSMKSVVIPVSVTEIGVGAFQSCTGLTDVVMSDSVTKLGLNAFMGCVNLEYITLSNNIESIDSMTFSGCSKLYGLSLPSKLKSIGTYAFRDCVSLLSVALPENLTGISAWAFSGCKTLSNVTVEQNVTSIGIDAFDGCDNLYTIVYRGSKEQWNKIVKHDGWRGNSPVSTVSCNDVAVVL